MNDCPYMVQLPSWHSKIVKWLHVFPVYLILVVQVVDDILESVAIINGTTRVPVEDAVLALIKVFRPGLGSVPGQANALFPYEVLENNFERVGKRWIMVSFRFELPWAIIVVLVRPILIVVPWVISSLGIVRLLVVIVWSSWNPIVVGSILILLILVALVEVSSSLVLVAN